MDTTVALFITALVLVAAAVAALLFAQNAKKRHRVIQRRFGPEYERALEEYGTQDRADRALAARARRVEKYRIRELAPEAQQRFSERWRQIQARFVDEPSRAVHEADELIIAVMQTRGYPMEDFEHRVADLSVDHPDVVQHYRAARALADANREGRANTEELRQAFVHFRALFADLLELPTLPTPTAWQEARP
jgi:hypothetical protein